MRTVGKVVSIIGVVWLEVGGENVALEPNAMRNLSAIIHANQLPDIRHYFDWKLVKNIREAMRFENFNTECTRDHKTSIWIRVRERNSNHANCSPRAVQGRYLDLFTCVINVLLTCIIRPIQCSPIQFRGPNPNVKTRDLFCRASLERISYQVGYSDCAFTKSFTLFNTTENHWYAAWYIKAPRNKRAARVILAPRSTRTTFKSTYVSSHRSGRNFSGFLNTVGSIFALLVR